MNIAIVAPEHVPPATGGAERLWRGLAAWIDAHTAHEATLVTLPSPEGSLPDLVESYSAFAALDVSGFDLVISGKYPAWMIDHPNHVVYMAHPLRGLYDTYAVFRRPRTVDPGDEVARSLAAVLDRPPSRAVLDEVLDRFRSAIRDHGAEHPAFVFPGPLARALVHWLDRVGLASDSVRAHFAISQTVAARAGYFPPGVTARVLLPPSDLAPIPPRPGRHFLHTGRLDAPKRVDLVIDAFARVPGDIPLKITGRGPEAERLRALAAGDPRIEFLGFVDDETLRDLYADAIAVPFVPKDEDFGLVALEAMLAGKPVVTTFDSGGPRELISHRHSGLVVAPEADPLGVALQTLADDRALARDLGNAGRERAARVTWEAVVEGLLADTRPRRARRGRPRVVVMSTFPVHPNLGGGQIRADRLHRALATRFDVDLVSLGSYGSSAERVYLDEGFSETVVPKSYEHHRREWEIDVAVELAVTDIVAAPLMRYTPAYVDALRERLDGAVGAVVSHPYLHPVLTSIAPELPFTYEAQDVEFMIKEQVLPPTPLGAALVELTTRIERDAYGGARLTTACSDEDVAALAARYGPRPAIVVPNGVDVDRTPFTTTEMRHHAARQWLATIGSTRAGWSRVSALALFIGSWHPPNVEALDVVVELAPTLPEVGFVVAGSVGMHVDPSELPANVFLTGVISHIAKLGLLTAAHVGLNPVTRGSGTNLKMVEYFAAGVPTVATEVASRGLDVVPGAHALVCDVGDFAEAIHDVLGDPGGSDRRARAARRLAEERYDWRRIGAGYAEGVAEALAS